MKQVMLVFFDNPDLEQEVESASNAFPEATRQVALYRGRVDSKVKIDFLEVNSREFNTNYRFKIIVHYGPALSLEQRRQQLRDAFRVCMFDARNTDIEIELLFYDGQSFESQALIDENISVS